MDHRTMNRGENPSVLGYGCMRFPLDRETHKIDRELSTELLRKAMAAGVTYYDTAWPYHNGESESFIGEVLSQYPRDSYYLATKLPCWATDSREKGAEIIEEQLKRLKTDYIDFYLIHALDKKRWEKMLELGIPSLLEEYQQQGKLRNLGFSFHDDYEVFEEILTYRKWDFCQIQLNYMDTEHQAGLKGLELARSMGIPVVVMEPVKGGSLAQPPEEVLEPLQALNPQLTPAAWAMRWVASQPGVHVVLSGMTTMEQLEDNLSTFSPFVRLDEKEEQAVKETAKRLRQRVKNGCTACGYCMPCPAGVDIPKNFHIWNLMSMYQNQRDIRQRWKETEEKAKASQCIKCGACEKLCPQHIPIREHLSFVAEEVEAFTAKTDR